MKRQMNFLKVVNDFNVFLETGGEVLVLLVFVSILFWTLIIEKIIYHKIVYKTFSRKLKNHWRDHPQGETWENIQLKTAQVSELKITLFANVSTMQVLIALFPLLGLLGTITGMVNVFDSMSSLGTNARAMASGISMATIPTMAGMLLAVLGLFAYTQLDTALQKKIRKLRDKVLKDSDA